MAKKQKQGQKADGIEREEFVYTGRQLDEIAFPLGGIGTGCVSLGGWGQWREWEIFNKPNKGHASGRSFFCLRIEGPGKDVVMRVLQGQPGGSYVSQGHGRLPLTAGLPVFSSCRFVGAFPMARVELSDPAVPVAVTIEAFNPFIPLDEASSSLPCAILSFRLKNRTRRQLSISLLGLLENMTGFPETGTAENRVRAGKRVSGVMMTTRRHAKESPRYGTMALTSPSKPAQGWARAIRGTDYASIWKFWNSFEATGLPPASPKAYTSGEKELPVGGLVLERRLAPGAELTVPILVTWLTPVSDAGGVWRTRAGATFRDAWHVAEEVAAQLPALERRTRLFTKRLYESTIPDAAKDAVGSQISILKSPTCLRFENGDFWGWEGCSNDAGCCPGTCTHVWNYAQALPYLFPRLERTIREQHFDLNMDKDGRVCFRQPLPPGTRCNIEGFHPAADGQMGGVIRVYREWLISGDDAWLARTWPACRKSLEYAWMYWDADKDGVMEGVQHNTYDNEFWGPNTMMGTLYLGALRAGEEMARHLGDDETADEYRRVFESGKAWIDANLFNGKWYVQQINDKANAHTAHPSTHLVKGEKIPRFQFGDGCLSDQLIGQWYAEMLGLGYLLKPAHVRKTLQSIVRYNWKADLSEHACLLRNFAVAGEAGLIISTWPAGGEPPYPFWFATEVWCGIEYQVASHLIYEGFVDEAMAIVKGVRDRHDGTRRNPWNEFECGHHYSRSLASYGVLTALSGFSYAAPRKSIGFNPRVSADDFQVFYSVDGAWGTYQQKRGKDGMAVELAVDEGKLAVRELRLSAGIADVRAVRTGQGPVPFKTEVVDDRAVVRLRRTVIVRPGKPLRVRAVC